MKTVSWVEFLSATKARQQTLEDALEQVMTHAYLSKERTKRDVRSKNTVRCPEILLFWAK